MTDPTQLASEESTVSVLGRFHSLDDLTAAVQCDKASGDVCAISPDLMLTLLECAKLVIDMPCICHLCGHQCTTCRIKEQLS